MTCKSSPTFRTISSISPRVFISVPRIAASRQRNPVSCGNQCATKLPAHGGYYDDCTNQPLPRLI